MGSYNIKIVELKVTSFALMDEPDDYEVGNVFSFSVTSGHAIAQANKDVHVLVTVTIFEPPRPEVVLSNIQVLSVFQIEGIEELLISHNNNIPDDLRLYLHGTSISTTRGILYSSLKGTYLQKAVLPIIDPASMNLENV